MSDFPAAQAQGDLHQAFTDIHVLHGMDDAWFLDHCGATCWALPGVDPDDLPVPWLSLFTFQDTVQPEAALIADRDGGVLLCCDSVQSWPDLDGCSTLAKGMTVAMGFNKRPANIGPPWKKIQTPAGGSLRADFERLLDQPFDSMIGGHGKPLKGGAKAALTKTVQAVFG